MRTLLFPAIAAIAMPASAHAHVGHVGELAGHSHWIGVGAVVVAGVIGAALALLPKKGDEAVDAAEEEVAEGEGETA